MNTIKCVACLRMKSWKYYNLFLNLFLVQKKQIKMNTENNKIIAEFMGFELTTDGIQTLYYDKDRDLRTLPKFHSDWNWLVKVLEKIKNIPNKEKYGMLKYEFDVILGIPNAQIVQSYKLYFGDKTDKYFDTIQYEGTFIVNTYNACVEFIKWYNQNK